MHRARLLARTIAQMSAGKFGTDAAKMSAMSAGISWVNATFRASMQLFRIGREYMQRNVTTDTVNSGLPTKKQACAKLNVCMRTLDYWIQSRAISYIKFRGGVRFLPEDIDAFIASRRVAAVRIPVEESKKAKSHPPTK